MCCPVRKKLNNLDQNSGCCINEKECKEVHAMSRLPTFQVFSVNIPKENEQMEFLFCQYCTIMRQWLLPSTCTEWITLFTNTERYNFSNWIVQSHGNFYYQPLDGCIMNHNKINFHWEILHLQPNHTRNKTKKMTEGKKVWVHG